MVIHRTEVASVPELTNAILEVKNELGDGSFLWFRGLSCTTYALLPKMMREAKPVDHVFEREVRLLTRFRQRSMAYWPTGYQQSDWEHMFAMQHYGLPTRLLDWSENLFVAAYFALDPRGSSIHDHEGDCAPAIWCVNPVTWNRAMPCLSEFGNTIHVLTTADDELQAYAPITVRKRYKSPVAIYGTHNSDRIVAQRGTFMVWGNESKSLEEVAEEQANADLWCFLLKGDRDALFKEIQFLGFSELWSFQS